MFGGIAWYLLVGFALAKMLATSLTLGSGGSGGLFTPTLFVGAAFGGGIGVLAHQLLPNFGLHPEAWALVGMAGLIAGTLHAPITAIFMVFEMTDDYNLVPPLMIVSVIALATARRFAKHGSVRWMACAPRGASRARRRPRDHASTARARRDERGAGARRAGSDAGGSGGRILGIAADDAAGSR